MKRSLCLCLCLLLPVPAARAYDLFHPVPHDKLRDLNPDRPSRSDGPGTVDAGHWQLEADLISFDHRQDPSAGSADTTQVGDFNLKLGLTDAVDLELIGAPWQRLSQRGAGTDLDAQGPGDMTLRVKQNWWGDDGGASAFGTITYLKWPSAAAELGNGAVEGGLTLPLTVSLPAGLNGGIEFQLGIGHDTGGEGYHAVYTGALILGRALGADLQAYAEVFAGRSQEAGAGLAMTVDAGLAWNLGKNLQLDGALNAGVTPPADAWNPVLGFTWRI